jgi:hypothetical protein
MNDYIKEAEYMREVILRKFVTGELDVVSLNRMLRRIYHLSYYNGRLDGEKYLKGRGYHDQLSITRRQIN